MRDATNDIFSVFVIASAVVVIKGVVVNSKLCTSLEIFALTSVRFAEQAEGECCHHKSQNKSLQAITYFMLYVRGK